MQGLVLDNQNLSERLTKEKQIKCIVNDVKNLMQLPEKEEPHTINPIESIGKQPSVEESHLTIPGISPLLPSLYLCGAAAAVPNNLEKLSVQFVINVAPELPDTPIGNNKPLYLRINAQDRSEENLAAHFDEVADMIEQVRQNGGKTLVHCVAGVSRSASLCIAYLMKHFKMSLRDSYLHVKSIRPQIRPNSGFFQQLRRYEEQLHGSGSVQMVFFESLNREIPDILEPEYRAMEDFYQRYRSALKRR